MECWGYKRTCAVELFIQTGSITVPQCRFCYELYQQEPYLQMQSTDGEGKGVKKALSRV